MNAFNFVHDLALECLHVDVRAHSKRSLGTVQHAAVQVLECYVDFLKLKNDLGSVKCY